MARTPSNTPRAAARQLAGHCGSALITTRTLHALYVDLLRLDDAALEVPALDRASFAATLRSLSTREVVYTAPEDRASALLRGTTESIFAVQSLEERLARATQRALDHSVRGTDDAVVLFTRDAALTEKTWREVLEFAARHLLPLVIVQQQAERRKIDLAELAIECGVPGIAADAIDAVALYRVVGESLGHARRGNGPTLVDAIPFPPATHHDPVAHLRRYLETRSLWSAALERRLTAQAAHKPAR